MQFTNIMQRLQNVFERETSYFHYFSTISQKTYNNGKTSLGFQFMLLNAFLCELIHSNAF